MRFRVHWFYGLSRNSLAEKNEILFAPGEVLETKMRQGVSVDTVRSIFAEARAWGENSGFYR